MYVTEAGFSRVLELAFTPEPKVRFRGSVREGGGGVSCLTPPRFAYKTNEISTILPWILVKPMEFQQFRRGPA